MAAARSKCLVQQLAINLYFGVSIFYNFARMMMTKNQITISCVGRNVHNLFLMIIFCRPHHILIHTTITISALLFAMEPPFLCWNINAEILLWMVCWNTNLFILSDNYFYGHWRWVTLNKHRLNIKVFNSKHTEPSYVDFYISMALIYVNYDTTYCSPLVFGNQNKKFSLDRFTTCDIGRFAYVHWRVSLSDHCFCSLYRFLEVRI